MDIACKAQVIGRARMRTQHMTERVLLTGITGYIGEHCAAELLRAGYEVVGVVRSRSKADATRAAVARVAPRIGSACAGRPARR